MYWTVTFNKQHLIILPLEQENKVASSCHVQSLIFNLYRGTVPVDSKVKFTCLSTVS